MEIIRIIELQIIWLYTVLCSNMESSQRLWQNPKCREGTYMTIYNNKTSSIHECSECTDILDVLIIVRETELRYGQTFTQIEKLCDNYLIYFLAIRNRSVGELAEHIQHTRKEQYLGSLDGYLIDVHFACNETSSICDEFKTKECREGYLPVYAPPQGVEKTIIKCIKNCDYGLFIKTEGGCYAGYCEDGSILTLSVSHMDDWPINVCQFGEKDYMRHIKEKEAVWTYLNGTCTKCDQEGNFWAFTTYLEDEERARETSICGKCKNWVMGMPGLLEKCQRSTCTCGRYEECEVCKQPTNYKFIDRDGKWKYCYDKCEGNITIGMLSFKYKGNNGWQCHLFGCRDGLMPTVREDEKYGEYSDFYCKDYQCDGIDDYMISIAVPGTPGWKEFYIDICVIP